ncbi:hypothetical protein [Vibrio sp. AND4]|uniref:hypothetical protein n=1 Tax=Vibrio sp. AND4 TaxID=314289 RepID=UPI00015F2DEC|nr:hypothetical protein AND4_17369 [Vibrio sp. AND4]
MKVIEIARKMNNNLLEQYLAVADQPVKDFMAEVLESLGKQKSEMQEPLITLHYFGALLEVRLVSFDGDRPAYKQNKDKVKELAN